MADVRDTHLAANLVGLLCLTTTLVKEEVETANNNMIIQVEEEVKVELPSILFVVVVADLLANRDILLERKNKSKRCSMPDVCSLSVSFFFSLAIVFDSCCLYLFSNGVHSRMWIKMMSRVLVDYNSIDSNLTDQGGVEMLYLFSIHPGNSMPLLLFLRVLDDDAEDGDFCCFAPCR